MKTRYGIIALVIVAIVIAFAIRMRSPQLTIPPTTAVFYACNEGKTITALYNKGESKPAPSPGEPPVPGGSVVLNFSDRNPMALAQTISADGVRYANADESFIFWSKGNGALVLENNQERSYIGCIAVAPEIAGQNLPVYYASGAQGFSLRLPSLATSTADVNSYHVDAAYRYEEFGPGKTIGGVKFTIPKSLAAGTNLSSDSYISAEEIPQTQDCKATLFVERQGAATSTVTEGNTVYSVASSVGAGAGNRYEETVYALPDTNPCVAVRYFIHYGVIENYPAGAVREFNKQALLGQFDAIRRTLMVVQ